MKYHITINELLENRITTVTKDAVGVQFYIDLCEAMPHTYKIVSIVPAN